MNKTHVIAWNSNPPSFIKVDERGEIVDHDPNYEGLCDLNGTMYSTGLSPDGRRWWYNVEAPN